MKVAELEGELLAQWVARANGWPVEVEGPDEADSPLYCRDEHGIPWSFTRDGYHPQEKWEQGGPIIDRERITLFNDGSPLPHGIWQAYIEAMQTYDGLEGRFLQFGATPLVAAMRAYVASKFGDEV